MRNRVLRHIGVFKLSDEEKEIQLLRVGRWKHPKYGDINITPSTFNRLEKNFNEDVRKVELAIDPEHKSTEGAHGWIKKVINKGMEGLYALVDWTKLGKGAIKDKIYKYVSAEYSPHYTDTETGKTHQDVLLGAALTNRPFIKGMKPVALSEEDSPVYYLASKEVMELYNSENKNDRRDQEMDPREQIVQWLSETAERIVELEELDEESKTNLLGDLNTIAYGLSDEEVSENVEDYEEIEEGVEMGLSEEGVRDIMREEIQMALQGLNKKVELTEDKTDKVVSTLKMAEIDKELNSMVFSEDTKVGRLTPAQAQMAKQFLTKDPQTANEFRKFIETMPELNLEEIGHAFGEDYTGITESSEMDEKKDPIKFAEVLAEKAKKLAESKGVSNLEAVKELMGK